MVSSFVGCAAVDIPPEETGYFKEQMAIARAAPRARAAGDEAAVLRESTARLEVRGKAESQRIGAQEETAGLVDVANPNAREFLAQIADPRRAGEVLATTTLDVDRALLAAYVRNPDVAAARANWAATVRMYEQATYLEELLLRYGAFARLATPRVGEAPMRNAAFPYPGLVALKGEMVDREVAMAREMVRMRLRDVVVATSKAWHGAVHQSEELKIRDEQLSLAQRMVETTRTRVASGKSPQAELLEMEAEVAMAENDRRTALAALERERAGLNTLLGRDPQAPLTLPEHFHDVPAQETLALEPLLVIARRFSPEIRIARAEAERSAAAIRMSEAMLFAPPTVGAVATGTPMTGSMPAAPQASSPPMGGMAGGTRPSAPPTPSLSPRDAPPSGAPGAFGPDVAWVAELKERHVGLERAAEEAVKATERRVIEAHFELESVRRTYQVAATSTEPLSAQALEERLRLYESGRGEFAELIAASRRHLDAAHAVVAARHDYYMAEAMLWMALGARPELVRDADGGERR